MMSLTVLVLFLLLTLLGAPIAVAMGSAAAFVIWWNDFALAVIAQHFWAAKLGRAKATPFRRGSALGGEHPPALSPDGQRPRDRGPAGVYREPELLPGRAKRCAQFRGGRAN